MSPLLLTASLLALPPAYLLPQALFYLQRYHLRRVCELTRSLVLTFDDGPGETLTDDLLDLLKCYAASATFFPLGRRIPGHEYVLDRIRREGHELGSHSYSHHHAWKTWPWQAASDIRRGYHILQPWAGPHAPFRPPYGKLSLSTWLPLWLASIPLGSWTIDSGDTHCRLPRPENLINRIRNGGVVLLHDHDARRPLERIRYVLNTVDLLMRTALREGLQPRCLKGLTGNSK